MLRGRRALVCIVSVLHTYTTQQMFVYIFVYTSFQNRIYSFRACRMIRLVRREPCDHSNNGKLVGNGRRSVYSLLKRSIVSIGCVQF